MKRTHLGFFGSDRICLVPPLGQINTGLPCFWYFPAGMYIYFNESLSEYAKLITTSRFVEVLKASYLLTVN
jgi:hypothetical protein